MQSVEAAAKAVAAIRAGGGPHFLELRTYRFRAHSMYDPERYRDKAEVEEWKRRDPLVVLGDRLRAQGALDDDAVGRFEAEIAAEIDDAVAFAEAGTLEPLADLTRFVHTEVER
jgi:pyruvate dehydrogenase E1 component alpha subunit